MSNLIQSTYQTYLNRENGFTHFHFLAAVLARVYVAQVFFSAGLTKIQDWETTLFLFEEEYQVPLLHFETAAVLGTLGELILPVLLFFGVLTRFSATGLFLVNVVAVISLAEIAPAALYLHYLWGILLAQIAIYGPGPLALDSFARKLMPKA
ncbi:DoxX family protein [Neptuniibacter halophilus]|uniref:DoxX family protein n=1 Tax=Neptuniibacter halophilus TaxID=651666 RepID=UPI0025730F6C|nr:DoxX family protein [Neptuniibacter halophilus]